MIVSWVVVMMVVALASAVFVTIVVVGHIVRKVFSVIRYTISWVRFRYQVHSLISEESQ